MNPAQFDIASQLLAGPDGDWRWNNLGYWQTAQDYSTACTDLARLHADTAGLTARSRVLELGCGYGASIDVWMKYDVEQIYALEYRPDCVNHIKDRYASKRLSVSQGRFDLPLPTAWQALAVDHVLCVDAAYHAQSLNAFLSTAHSALKAQGVLCFSTLMLPQSNSRFGWRMALMKAIMKAAKIPKLSHCTATEIQQQCAELGFANVQIRPLEPHVFNGFSSWVWQQQKQLKLTQRYSAGWQKIAATARLCRWLENRKTLHYVVIRAVKSH